MNLIDQQYEAGKKLLEKPDDNFIIRNECFKSYFLKYLKENNLGNLANRDDVIRLKLLLIISIDVTENPNAVIISPIPKGGIIGEIVTKITVHGATSIDDLFYIFMRNEITDFSKITIGESIARKYDIDHKYNIELYCFPWAPGADFGDSYYFYFTKESLKELIFRDYRITHCAKGNRQEYTKDYKLQPRQARKDLSDSILDYFENLFCNLFGLSEETHPKQHKGSEKVKED